MKKPKQMIAKKEFDKMATAISEYIKAMGGSAIVIGGVSIDDGDLSKKYFIRIAILGEKPTKKVL